MSDFTKEDWLVALCAWNNVPCDDAAMKKYSDEKWSSSSVEGWRRVAAALRSRQLGGSPETDASEAATVCYQAYQLVGQLVDLIPDADKWLDNLSEARLVHDGLLPVVVDVEGLKKRSHERTPDGLVSVSKFYKNEGWNACLEYIAKHYDIVEKRG